MSHDLVLSLFPGIDLLGRGFESEGFCVVRGPDLVWGGDIRTFSVPPGKFKGVIGGPPCQKFSRANRSRPDPREGLEMIDHFLRVVSEARPDWFLMENVPGVPGISSPAGYKVQRFNLTAGECGGRQRRNRVFFFGSRLGHSLVIDRSGRTEATEPTAMATEGAKRDRRSWADFCWLQGIDPLELPGLSIAAKYRAVGNGVPVFMAAIVARAIKSAGPLKSGKALCSCGCGRLVSGRQYLATAACRKRAQRFRDGAARPL